MLLPAFALAEDPVTPDPTLTVSPDPTIVDLVNLDPLSDDPGAGIAPAAPVADDAPVLPPDFAYEIPAPVEVPFIDRAHLAVWNTVWKSAMRTDSWFGGGND
ncbi:MAG: hypothetical protein ABUL69_04630, partial [Peristeroidobacter soli]